MGRPITVIFPADRVRDSGIGIPTDMLARVFDPFTQVSRPLDRAHSGLGVGLTLVKRLIELHGGRITADSEGTGHGSEFVIHLPLLDGRTVSGSGASADAGASGTATSRRVLVVDDNDDAATGLALMVRLLGHEARTAGDGLGALQMAADFRPDVMFLDIGMPTMNGYEVARRLREQPWGKRVMLVTLTGWGQAEYKRRATEAGFDHHVVKPRDPAVLRNLLASRPSGGG